MTQRIEFEVMTQEQLKEWDESRSQLQMEKDIIIPFHKHIHRADKSPNESSKLNTAERESPDVWKFCGIKEVKECRK